MKREKSKNIKEKEKYKYITKNQLHYKNPTENLQINLSYPIKININNFPKKINLFESAFVKNKMSISPKQSIISKNKFFNNNGINKEKTKNNINKSQKNTINYMKENNSSFDNKNKQKESNIDKNNIKDKPSINNFYNMNANEIKNNFYSSSIKNRANSKYFNNQNNLNEINTEEPFNNDLFSNLFIDSSSDIKNVLVSELDIELSNIEQSNCNKKNDKSDNNQNMNIIDDEEDTNQKSNEHINVYKKIELRFKNKIEKSLNKYFQKNGTNYYVGDSNSNQKEKQIENIENHNKSKSNQDIKKNVKEKKNEIKKLINSDSKVLNNIKFTIDLRESRSNKKVSKNKNKTKLSLIKNKLKDKNIKKFQKITYFKSPKLNNNNPINKKDSKKIIKKDCSSKNRIIKQYKYSPSETKTLTGERKIKAIYSKIINDANIINKNKNKNKISKEKEIVFNNINKNKKNNSTGIRLSYKNSPYYLHSINSIKSKKDKLNQNNKNKKNKFKYNFNHLYHHNMNNNIFRGEITISSSYKNTKRKNIETNNVHYKNNISYLNNSSAKNKNKLYKFFSFPLNDDKEHINNGTQRLKNKMINNTDIHHKINDINKKGFKSYNYKIRGKPLNNYKGLNTEINNFSKKKFLSINNGINRKSILSNRKLDNKDKNDELIIKRNMKNKIKSDLSDDNSDNSIFIYKKSLFLCYSPYKNINIFQHNSFKKKLPNKL